MSSFMSRLQILTSYKPVVSAVVFEDDDDDDDDDDDVREYGSS